MQRDLNLRLLVAGLILLAMVVTIASAAQIGVVHVGAGDMRIALGKGDTGFVMDIASRHCPPNCGIDFDWRPLVH